MLRRSKKVDFCGKQADTPAIRRDRTRLPDGQFPSPDPNNSVSFQCAWKTATSRFCSPFRVRARF